MEQLDKKNLCNEQLYREHCTFHNGAFVKDMARLGRPLEDSIIIDNSALSYMFQPENAMPIKNWYDDPKDTELLNYIPLLERLAFVDDVRKYLPKMVSNNQIDYKKAIETVRKATFKDQNQTSRKVAHSESRVPENESNKENNRSKAFSVERGERRHQHKQPHQTTILNNWTSNSQP